MIVTPNHCPDCDSIDVIKHGTTSTGKQRYLGQNSDCSRRTFILDYSYAGYSPEVKRQIYDMAMNGSGIRDTERVLHISPNTVIEALKKRTSPPSGQ